MFLDLLVFSGSHSKEQKRRSKQEHKRRKGDISSIRKRLPDNG